VPPAHFSELDRRQRKQRCVPCSRARNNRFSECRTAFSETAQKPPASESLPTQGARHRAALLSAQRDDDEIVEKGTEPAPHRSGKSSDNNIGENFFSKRIHTAVPCSIRCLSSFTVVFSAGARVNRSVRVTSGTAALCDTNIHIVKNQISKRSVLEIPNHPHIQRHLSACRCAFAARHLMFKSNRLRRHKVTQTSTVFSTTANYYCFRLETPPQRCRSSQYLRCSSSSSTAATAQSEQEATKEYGRNVRRDWRTGKLLHRREQQFGVAFVGFHRTAILPLAIHDGIAALLPTPHKTK
jgi:hypothetical protein